MGLLLVIYGHAVNKSGACSSTYHIGLRVGLLQVNLPDGYSCYCTD
jgi:hypothetical protein